MRNELAAGKTKIFLLLLGLVLTVSAAAQEEDAEWWTNPEVETLVRDGIKFHDAGEFDRAIDCYLKALEIMPDTAGIYYELAFSYLYKGDGEAALAAADKGIILAEGQGDLDLLPVLYDVKGSALDDLERRNEAIGVYLEAIDRFGAGNTRLYYNLGLAWYREGETENAKNALALGLLTDPFHSTSNYLLGKICYELGRNNQSLYALCYYLLLEAYTGQAMEAYEIIKQILGAEEDSPEMVEKMREIFSDTSFLDEPLWDSFYIPFFSRLAASEHLETFCHYIGFNSSEKARNWLDRNEDRLDALFEFLNEGNDGGGAVEEGENGNE